MGAGRAPGSAARAERSRALACVGFAAIFFFAALVRISTSKNAARPRRRRHEVYDFALFFGERDVTSAAPVCAAANASVWFEAREKPIVWRKDPRQGDYCGVEGNPYAHCPLPCLPAPSDDRGRKCLMSGGTRSCKAHVQTKKAPGPGSHDVEVFVRTYRRDLLGGVLLYALESIRRYRGDVIRGVSLCYPVRDEFLFRHLPRRFPDLAVRLNPVPTDDDGLPIFYDLVHTDRYTSAPYVMHLDGDMLLYHVLSSRELFDPERGVPYLSALPWSRFDDRVREANKPSMDWLGLDAADYGLLGRLIYPRDAYSWMRKRIRKKHKGDNLATIIKARGHMDNYSPFAALLLYLHNDSVSVVHGHLRSPYVQLDGKHMDNVSMNVAHCLACHGPTTCETAIWDTCKPPGAGSMHM